MNDTQKILRDRKLGTDGFRAASRKICMSLMRRTRTLLKRRGVPTDNIVIVIILRSGVALLDQALRVFPKARVGVLGMKRDERTFVPHWYYENLPKLTKRSVIVVLDPMLATGGSAKAAAVRAIKGGASPKNIYFAGIIAAPEGFSHLAEFIPRGNILVASLDKGLDADKIIVPGIGDFGDRYFGYAGRPLLDCPAPDFNHREWIESEEKKRKALAHRTRKVPVREADEEDRRKRLLEEERKAAEAAAESETE